jgi:subtilisin-like proprotein convertase family protein
MRNMKRSRVALVGALALALSVTLALTAAGVASAKKKKAGGTVDITKQVNQAVPDGTATTDGVLASTIQVGGKKFKGTVIRDVNVTLQTTGSNATAAQDLDARLTAPNGATTELIEGDLFGQSVGPLTFDDESPNSLVNNQSGPSSREPTMLGVPYVGSAQPDCFAISGTCTLWPMDNGPASGTWTLRVYDTSATAGRTSVLNLWRLTVVAGKPYLTK